MWAFKYFLLSGKQKEERGIAEDRSEPLLETSPRDVTMSDTGEEGVLISSVSRQVDNNPLYAMEATSMARLSTDASDSEDSSLEEDGMLIKNRCSRCRRSGLCSFTLYVWLAVFVLGCFAAMLVVGVVVVGPFRRVSHFRDTKCTSVGFQYAPEMHQCSCGKGCKSSYRCLLIKVFYHQMNGQNTTEQSIVFENEIFLNRKVSFYFTLVLSCAIHVLSYTKCISGIVQYTCTCIWTI